MKSEMNKIKTIVIAGAIAILLFLYLQPRKEYAKEILKQKQKVLSDSIRYLKSDVTRLGKREKLYRDTVERLRADKERLSVISKKAKVKKDEALLINVEVPDSLNIGIVRERLENDERKLAFAEVYIAELENEIMTSNDLINALTEQDNINKAMLEAKDLLIKQTEAQFENQKKLTKEERRGKRRWRAVAIAAPIAILLVLL